MEILFLRLLRAARRENYRAAVSMLSCAATLLLPCIPACAYDTDSQAWGLFTFNARYKSGLRVYAEVQPRQGDNFERFSQLLLRPAVGYQVTPKMSLWIGYAWTPSFLPEYNNEHRAFQQVLFEDRYQRVGLINRTRLEERSIEGAGGTSLRFRHQIRASLPLDSKGKWAAVSYDEFFYNLNSVTNGPQAGFDQNRLYFAGAYNVNRHTRVELGYLASFINRPRNLPDRRIDALVLTVNYNL